MLTRRFLLQVFLASALSVHLGGGSALGQVFFRPRKRAAPRGRENLFVQGDKALIGIAGGDTVEDMVAGAVSLIGGFERLALRGKTVLVKPNVVSGRPHPATTNPEVVGSVVRLLYAGGAKKVYVGDMSALMTLSTKRNMRNNGIKAAAEDNGAEVVTFEDHDWVEVELPGTMFVKSAYVTEWLYKVDLVVNLPVIKTHSSATYSITLKNFIGCTHLKQRPYLIDSSRWEEIVAEFNAAYTPDLNIVDGTVSMIEGGPWEGTPEATNIIIAGGDRVGCDAAGLAVIKSFGKWRPVVNKDVWDQRQIRTAIEVGAGSPREGLKLVTGEGDEKFTELVKKIKEHTGL